MAGLLMLAGQTVSVDVVLRRLVDRPEVFGIRLLDAPEKPETLPAWLRSFTLEHQKQAFAERVLAGARGNHEQAESACRQRHDEEPLWAELQACAAADGNLDRRIQALQTEAAGIVAAVESEADTASGGVYLTRLVDLTLARDQRLRKSTSAGKNRVTRWPNASRKPTSWQAASRNGSGPTSPRTWSILDLVLLVESL